MQENSQIWEAIPPKITPAPIKTENSKAFLFSIGALGIVIIFVAAMSVLKMFTESSTNAAIAATTDAKAKIEAFKKDRQILIASLLADNSLTPSINLKSLVNDFNRAAQKASVRFQGFSVKDDVITTNVISFMAPNGGTDAVEGIFNMMKIYSQDNAQANFRLEPILSISGTPQSRTTPVSFKIIPVKTEAQAPQKTATSSNS